jgi:class 3 adenylate cyclase
MLYADLADSTRLVIEQGPEIAAKVFSAFLVACTRLIRAKGGEIRSFDGDRVMGVFLGHDKNTRAAKCALHINFAFQEIVRPRLEAKFPSLATSEYELAHGVGIDTGDVLVVQGGIRNNNDLVWTGSAANVAAKLSAIRHDDLRTFITTTVHSALHKSARISNSNPPHNMWGSYRWDEVDGVDNIFASSWQWEL